MEKVTNVHRVRLISKDGELVEDMVEQGRVLFLTNHPVAGPFQLEAYTDSGALLGVQTVFDYGRHDGVVQQG